MSATRVYFVRPAPATSGWRLFMLLAGLATLLPAGAHWLRTWQAHQTLQARIAAVQPARQAAAPTLAPALQRELDQQTIVVAHAVRQLNLPVPRLLKTLQTPPGIRVALLGLDLNGQPGQDAADGAGAGTGAGTGAGAAAKPGSGSSSGASTASPDTAVQGPAGTLKISAEAESAQDMLAYLAFLNQQPMFRSVYLVKHETAATEHAPYRFQLEAQWRQ